MEREEVALIQEGEINPLAEAMAKAGYRSRGGAEGAEESGRDLRGSA
jgi:hypothetical protein